jgi:prephenate dehydratase/chorismate mutase
MSLKDLRENIDKIDFEIIKLLKQRMEFAIRTIKFKAETKDSCREEEIIKNLRERVESLGFLEFPFVEKLYKEILDESKKLQAQKYSLIGFQGEHGAYGEVAARTYNPAFVPIPFKDFSDVFDAVSIGGIDFGIVPIENNLGGMINDTNNLMLETELSVIAEIYLPVHHCLMTLPDTDYRDIKVVYSHPQALAQCRNFLKRNNIEPVPYYDTAGSAMMLVKERVKGTAVIASSLCADLYGLEILKENIEDTDDNVTRFMVISGKAENKGGKKCSIIFSVAHAQKAGVLFDILKIFADSELSLTRIESIPNRKATGNYMFMLDFVGSDKDAKVANVLQTIKSRVNTFKFLGCY